MDRTGAANYKARKEAFVSNLSGSSINEINAVTIVAPAAVFLWTILQRQLSFFSPYGPVAFVTDFLLNVCAILFAITAYSSAPVFLDIAMITPAVFLLILPPNGLARSRAQNEKLGAKSQARDPKNPSQDVSASATTLVARPFLTHYRGAMLIVTVLAILAVDFPIFPRRFAKVETWGTSLMDIGVGSFVFSAGVVSARALYKSSPSGKKPRLGLRFVQTIHHSLPLWVLGIIRLISVKGLDYAEHVTEYGVHWNFFFTLALLPPFVEVADTLITSISKKYSVAYSVLALAIAVAYETVLNSTSLLSYILISPRGPDLLSRNREGVFSFFGYLAIFLAGRGTGSNLVKLATASGAESKTVKKAGPHDTVVQERIQVLRSLATYAICPVAGYWFTTSIYAVNLTVSRRLANLPYVLWVVAFNQIQIVLFGLAEMLGPTFSYGEQDKAMLKNASSKVMQVFNQNGLVIFLVANLLTGMVNMSVNTLDMSSIGSMSILIGYAGIVTAVAMGMDYAGIKIKI